MALFTLDDPGDLDRPSIVAAFDGWVDAGSAATSAAARLAEGAQVVATFDADVLFDYRARRPTLEIRDGRLVELTWPELAIRRTKVAERDVLVLTGAEPDYRWQAFAAAVVALAEQLGVAEWLSLGAIPAAVPHTRPVPILGTESAPGLLRGEITAGPSGLLRVPAAALSILEMAVAEAGIPAVGYFAQVPHYVSGPYPAAALELLEAVGRHLGGPIPDAGLTDEARAFRSRLDLAAAAEDTTRSYVERLEAMVDEQRQPAGDDLIADIERFLRDRGTGNEGTRLN